MTSRLEDTLEEREEPVSNLRVGVAGFEAKPEDFLEAAKPHQHPVNQMSDSGAVVRTAIGVPHQPADVLTKTALLPRAPDGCEEVREPEVGPSLDVFGDDGKTK